jgi:hypothetical protein
MLMVPSDSLPSMPCQRSASAAASRALTTSSRVRTSPNGPPSREARSANPVACPSGMLNPW